MTIEELKSLPRIYNQPQNIQISKDYLESRGLPEDPRIAYCHYIPSVNLRNQLIYMGKSYNGRNNILESRSLINGAFSKLYNSDSSIPIWNIEKYQDQQKIILTEAVLDAESIQILNVENSITLSTYRASFSSAQFYYIMAVFHSKDIYMCFDQDRSGIENAKRFMDQAKRLFNKEIHMIELSLKDSNKVLVSKGKDFLKKEILSQLI